jgi:hypothetical protein
MVIKYARSLSRILYFVDIVGKIRFIYLCFSGNEVGHGLQIRASGNAYRIRVADYRVIYEIRDNTLLVGVIELGHRKDVY